MKIKFKKEDFYKCFEFPVKYYLDETKSKSNRTTGQQRGLGSIINDFFLGKLIEIGVARAIEEKNSNKKIHLDFGIHKPGENHDNDPDIVKVTESGKDREPKLYLEIKNVSENDRFIGLTSEQCSTMLGSKIISNDPSRLFIVYGTVSSSDKSKICDVFGAYLKSEIKDSLLDGFAEIDDIYLEIKSVINAKELTENCLKFDKGSLFYETEILGPEIADTKANKIRVSGYETRNFKNEVLPIIMMNGYPAPKEFGDFRIEGQATLFVKTNDKSKRIYLDCHADGYIENKSLGRFELKNGKMYELFFTTIGRNPVLSRNNLWIARRNVHKIIPDTVEKRIEFISQNI